MQAFKNAQYPEAVENFKTAVELDPSFPDRAPVSGDGLHAAVHSGRRFAGEQSDGHGRPRPVPEGAGAGTRRTTVAIASIASLYLNQKKWDEAQQWYEKLIAVDPNNADAYYSLGFIAWSKWYPVYGTARANLGMKQEDPGPIKDKKVREELKAKYGPVIEGGLQALDKALQIDPEYDDAMAYENLLIRERADLDGHQGRVREADQDRRRLGAEGPGHQEDQGREESRKPGGGIVVRTRSRSGFANVSAPWRQLVAQPGCPFSLSPCYNRNIVASEVRQPSRSIRASPSSA